MSGPGYHRILRSTALALILFSSLGAVAQEAGRSGRFVAVPGATNPAKTAESSAAAAGEAAPGDAASPGATEQEAAPDPLASLDPAERPFAEKIRDLFAAKSDRIFTSKKERAAIETFYRNRTFVPLWLDKGVESARAKAVIARLKRADDDGLQPSDYRTPNFLGASPESLAEADLKLTQAVITYARHVQAGRFPYNRISKNIELPQAAPEPAEILAKVTQTADAAKALDEFSPQNEGYQKLKAKLAEMRGRSAATGSELAEGIILRHNAKSVMEDARVPSLRQKLGLAGDPDDLKYDGMVAEAVKQFQRARGLPPTGNLDSRTIKALNGPARAEHHIDLVIANMERWRWYSRDLGTTHVVVNQPDFTLKVMHKGDQIWTTRIVIGKTKTPTPLLSETMKHITINPTWNVPPSIVYNEYLPALRYDPTVLRRMGLRVSYSRNGVHISQPPGERNALGRIRFNFPNRFLVYQHDTQDKHLFAHDVRAYSHGCMRVQDPAKYAEVLFNIARPSEGWTADKVTSMFGTAEQNIQLEPTPIWVHLTYQTAFVDETGKLQVRPDIYQLDGRTLAAIKSERSMIEPATERRYEIASGSGGRRRASLWSRGAATFDSWFGGGPVQTMRTLRPPRRIYY